MEEDSYSKKITSSRKNKIVELKNKNDPVNEDKEEPKEINLDDLQNNINRVLYQIKEDTINGEIISFKLSDINAYITIKTKDRQLKCIFWKIKLDNKFNEYMNLKDGDKVKITGRFSIMKKDLSIYFNINNIEKEGTGEYMNMYYEYRKKIIENRWDQDKRELYKIPLKIGIVTSLEGAAIEDILKAFTDDKFRGKIIIKNAVVQGKSCAESVINGIMYFEKEHNNIDILLITRGGGSYEDLVGFSSWNLIEKINNTKLLTISAVGHQVDNQLSDEVSDYKCATPSLGAKLIIEKQKEYITKLAQFKERIENIEKIFHEGKEIFNNINYDKLIKKYELQEMNDKHKKYTKIYNSIIDEYTQSKISFMKKMSEIKPSLFRNENELFSLNDFVDTKNNKTIKPKEMQIKFIDGSLTMTYTITEYNTIKKRKIHT